MKRKIIVFIIAAAAAAQANAQLQWPAITHTTKPWSRWWWQGSAVDAKNLTIALERYRAAGLGGLEITPIYGVKGHEDRFINFLSPKWMDVLQHTLKEARRLDLGIDLANATGWPFGGPWITPEDACKNIQAKTYILHKGEQVKEPLRFTQQPFYRSESKAQVDIKTLSYPIATNKNLQAYAFDQVRFEMVLKPFEVIAYRDNGEVIELKSKLDSSGRLDWTAPAGEWKVLALFMGWHGKMVERAAPGGEGDVIDHFNEKALQHYLARFDKAFAGRDMNGIRSFFNDSYEVDDARGQSNWTPDLLQQFKNRRGYDLVRYLPLLFGRDSSETGRRVLADYRQTLSDLLLDHFTRPWQQWAESKHKLIRNQSHGSPANILDLYAVVDIPETEGADILRFKFATSTAHVMGKRLASAETATWLNEHFQSSLGDVKQAVDKYFVGGVNHVVWHGTVYSPADEPWPGWLFYAAVHFTPANSFWRDFGTLNNYVARCQSFLQQGQPDNDILLYFPFNDRITDMGRDLLLHFDGMEGFDKTNFKSGAESLLRRGYSFDLVSDKQLQAVQLKSGTLQTGGTDYKTIILPDTRYMPLETMQKLKQAAASGATIIFYKRLPASVPGMNELEKRQATFSALLADLHFSKTTNSAVQTASVGKGRFLLGDDLDQLLNEAKIRRESLADGGLQFIRRRFAKGHCYFISNPTANAVMRWLPLQVKDKQAAIFNPMNDTSGLAKTRVLNGATEVWIQLEAGESCIIQTGNALPHALSYPYFTTAEQAQVLDKDWQLEFISGGPVLPLAQKLNRLVSWTELGYADANRFSGTALYTTHFPKPSSIAAYFQLDLGTVQETAEVWLNGKKLATLIGPQFKLNIPATVLKDDNLLQVYVTNGMANRIADMDKRGVAWKKFYNTNFPARLPQNRGADGLFTAAGWQPKASGLPGPVRLIGLRAQN